MKKTQPGFKANPCAHQGSLLHCCPFLMTSIIKEMSEKKWLAVDGDTE